MTEIIKYHVFSTKWGFFGVAGNKQGILRTLLPQAKKEAVKAKILKLFPDAKPEKSGFEQLKNDVLEYFDGKKVDFASVPIYFNGLNPFAKKVLEACRRIPAGNTFTYKQLAQKAGSPGASRGVGTVMAKNPVPLIIPCHRVIRSDGKIGNFSALGGKALKRQLLLHENSLFIPTCAV